MDLFYQTVTHWAPGGMLVVSYRFHETNSSLKSVALVLEDMDTRPTGCSIPPSKIRRMVLADSLEKVLSSEGDSIIPIILPMNVVEKCNQLVSDALSEHGLPASEPLLIPALKPEFQRPFTKRSTGGENLVPMLWHIDSVRAWQLIDRRIDEWVSIL